MSLLLLELALDSPLPQSGSIKPAPSPERRSRTRRAHQGLSQQPVLEAMLTEEERIAHLSQIAEQNVRARALQEKIAQARLGELFATIGTALDGEENEHWDR